MATARLSKTLQIHETGKPSIRILGEAHRCLNDAGREIVTDKIQVEVFMAPAAFMSASVADIFAALKKELSEIPDRAKATDVQKRFKGLTVS